MRKGQDRNINRAGKAGCLGLLALGFALINPVGSMAFAEGEEVADEAGVPVTQADTPSTIGISFSPAAGSASLSPISSAGQSAQVKVLATVNVQRSGGYSVYVKSNSQNLVGTNDDANVIPGMQGSVTYANIPVNTWGYYAAEGSAVPDNAAYKAISTSGNGDKIAENTRNNIVSDTKTIVLSFAARVNDEKPADTYQNTVTMSVVSSPIQLSFADQGVATMQQMTSAACDAVPVGQEAQLQDTRDGKFYWVTKLADNRCWMTQNLDLDLTKNVKLTSDKSDVPAAGYTPNFTTATVASSSTISNSNTGQNSWSLGDYRIIDPEASTNCGYPLSDASKCPGSNATSGLTSNRFTAYTTPTEANGDEKAHYIIGNYYQWNVATAGTGGTIASGQTTSSICPKGWKLPTSNGGELDALVAALGGTSSTNNVTKAPFYGVRSGYVDQRTDYLFNSAGYLGGYWSSTPSSNTSQAYYFRFDGATTVTPANTTNRSFGFSVRCIAR